MRGTPVIVISLDETPRFNAKEQEDLYYKFEPEPPPLPKEESKLQKLREFCGEVEFILQTVNENEYQAAVTYMEKPYDDWTKAVIFPSAGTVVGEFAGHKAALIQTNVGTYAGSYIDKAIHTFPKAKFVLGVGVGYAFDRKKFKLGDVIVSSKICNLANFKIDASGNIINRGEIVQTLPPLFVTFCKSLRLRYPVSKPEPPAEEGRNCVVHAGTYASFSILMDNKENRDKFKAVVPEVMGGEMEGGELLKFQQREKDPRKVIIIKGVVDYGDGTKEKSWQFTAAMAAFFYAHTKLRLWRGT